MEQLWYELWIAFCLLLVIEGIIPFLYPQRWRQMVYQLSMTSDQTLRFIGLGSMVCGVVLLVISR